MGNAHAHPHPAGIGCVCECRANQERGHAELTESICIHHPMYIHLFFDKKMPEGG
jgi:hypothetical protein